MKFDIQSQNTRKQILGLFTNRWAIGCLSILFIQQLMESSSTYWVVKLMASITLGQEFVPYLILYLASIALPYIPWCIAFILKISWKQESQRSFINAFIESNKNNIGEWSNRGLKEEKLSVLSSEGPAALHALIDYFWDLYTYVLSVAFSIIALSIVVEPLFAVAYALSFSIVIIVMKLKRKTQRLLTKKALTARVDLCQSLLAGWDNVLLGNNYNFKIWLERTSQRITRCLQRNVDLERFDQILAIAVALITSIPTLLVVVFYVYKYQADPAKLSAFVAILPILFLILNYTYQTLSLAFRWSMHSSKLKSLYKTIQSTRDTQLTMEKKVKWQKIFFNHNTDAPNDHVSLAYPKQCQTYLDLLEYTTRSGRLTIRGENGSGKSTALMLIKHALANRAFFLPTQNHLNFESETNKHSTGESLKNRLLEILNKVDVDVLLLDEWDANLDTDNQEKLSLLIDELAKKKCVIEVRHR